MSLEQKTEAELDEIIAQARQKKRQLVEARIEPSTVRPVEDSYARQWRHGGSKVRVLWEGRWYYPDGASVRQDMSEYHWCEPRPGSPAQLYEQLKFYRVKCSRNREHFDLFNAPAGGLMREQAALYGLVIGGDPVENLRRIQAIVLADQAQLEAIEHQIFDLPENREKRQREEESREIDRQQAEARREAAAEAIRL